MVVEVLRTASDENNRDAVLGGAMYFVGELLNWTLPSVLLALSSAIEHEGFVTEQSHTHDSDIYRRATATIHIEVLRTLITSPKCPLPALQIAGYSILRILSAPFVHDMAKAIECNLDDVGAKVRESLGMPSGALDFRAETRFLR